MEFMRFETSAQADAVASWCGGEVLIVPKDLGEPDKVIRLNGDPVYPAPGLVLVRYEMVAPGSSVWAWVEDLSLLASTFQLTERLPEPETPAIRETFVSPPIAAQTHPFRVGGRTLTDEEVCARCGHPERFHATFPAWDPGAIEPTRALDDTVPEVPDASLA